MGGREVQDVVGERGWDGMGREVGNGMGERGEECRGRAGLVMGWDARRGMWWESEACDGMGCGVGNVIGERGW